eukprot:4488115-Prymnesium_polylepis.1
MAYAQLGGALPLPPPENAFWFGGCLRVQAWWGAHALLRDWRQASAANAQRDFDARAAATAALSTPPAPALAPVGQPDGSAVAAHAAGL